MAELVIGLTLFPIHQDIVGLGGFLEFCVCVRIIRIAIRMVLHRHPAVGLLYILVIGVVIDAQRFVIIAFCHVSPR